MTTPSATLPKSAMPLNILIIGAGVCGPAIALLLQRSNPKHTITVVERFPCLRTGGQQLDLKSQGIPIMRKLGLLEEIRKYCVQESGMEFIDKNGKRLMQFGITSAEEKSGAFRLTNEFEFMRGDFVKVFYDASVKEREQIRASGEQEGGLKYEFDKTITALDQSDSSGVTVTFSDDQIQHFDLVIAADGQGSRTRRLAFGEDISKEAFKSLTIHAAYYNIPRLPSEDNLARIYFAPGNRMVMTRTGDRPLTQIYLFLLKNKERAAKMRSVQQLPPDEQKKVWTNMYADAGWDCPRFLDGLKDVDDFYACEIGQVRMPLQQLHKDHVVLLGDAGYCPSAFTGNGTTLSLIGTYVLAGELARHANDVDAALKAYEETMREPIEQCQQLSALGNGNGFYPSSALGIWLVNSVVWGLSCLRVDKLIKWVAGFMPEGKGGWEVPEYPELKMSLDDV